ncbi:MAG: hypothetical protein JF593_14890 [Novosphingobium sp.]|nr:hypothetical protein [Novosphingobium sp.]
MTARTQLVETVATPQHFTPPTARELRAQAVHRLQIGMFGLAAMLLIVGLANIIMERARLADAASGAAPVASSAAASPSSDPLADLGVVPSAAPADGAGAQRNGRRQR